jgi:hypothetical protein
MKIRKDDTVILIAGKDRGKKAKYDVFSLKKIGW